VNNGAMWAGRGFAAAASAGFTVRTGPFSAAIYPVAAAHENRKFVLAPVNATGYSPLTYAGHIIDWPQRFGEEAFWTLSPGQSYVRVDAFGLSAGVSTENMWLGPAQRLPLLMGSSAPGFPHAFIATGRPIDIYIGRVEAQAFTGRLGESDYFDNDDDNDARQLSGLSAVFEPRFAPGLFIGFNRMFLARFSWNPNALIIDPYVDVRENPVSDNQLVSLYARWLLPTAGFEVYAEWAREDHWDGWKDLLLEPDHSQAYMLGFQKTGSLGTAQLRWFGELAHLESALSLRGGRGIIPFYTHSGLTQGFTHEGQLLGAWIGPGSDAQLLGVEHSKDLRTTGLMIERVRFDDDAYYTLWGRMYAHNGHDVSIGLMLQHSRPLGPLHGRAALGLARRHNRNFVYFDGGQPGNYQADTNFQLDIDLRWSPRR
jgi:hypothetical protein